MGSRITPLPQSRVLDCATSGTDWGVVPGELDDAKRPNGTTGHALPNDSQGTNESFHPNVTKLAHSSPLGEHFPRL